MEKAKEEAEKRNQPNDFYRYVEGDWISAIIQRKCVAFDDYLNSIRGNQEEVDKWTFSRARRLITAMIPAIFSDAHIEEVLFDFLTDFVLPFVLPTEIARIGCNSTQLVELSAEIVKAAETIIGHLASTVLLEKLLLVAKSYIVLEHQNDLYAALYETTLDFRVPDPLILPERVPPPANAPKEVRKEFDRLLYEDLVAYDMDHAEIKAKSIQWERSFEFLKLLIQFLL